LVYLEETCVKHSPETRGKEGRALLYGGVVAGPVRDGRKPPFEKTTVKKDPTRVKKAYGKRDTTG